MHDNCHPQSIRLAHVGKRLLHVRLVSTKNAQTLGYRIGSLGVGAPLVLASAHLAVALRHASQARPCGPLIYGKTRKGHRTLRSPRGVRANHSCNEQQKHSVLSMTIATRTQIVCQGNTATKVIAAITAAICRHGAVTQSTEILVAVVQTSLNNAEPFTTGVPKLVPVPLTATATARVCSRSLWTPSSVCSVQSMQTALLMNTVRSTAGCRSVQAVRTLDLVDTVRVKRLMVRMLAARRHSSKSVGYVERAATQTPTARWAYYRIKHAAAMVARNSVLAPTTLGAPRAIFATKRILAHPVRMRARLRARLICRRTTTITTAAVMR